MAQPQSIAWSGIALRFVACYAVVLVMNHLASSLPGAPQHPVLDLRFGFDSKAVHDTFRVYGQKGRRTYLIADLMDFLYMYLYQQWMSMFMTKAVATVAGPARLLQPTATFPRLAALADVGETVLIVIMLLDMGSIDRLARYASIFNQTKWLLAYAAIGAVVVSGLMLLACQLAGMVGGRKQTAVEKKAQ